MNPLEKIIAERIKKEGPITFETFMDMALYYPEIGYYSSPNRTIGREGDFYTSPHLHPLFGAMLAKQLMEMWDSMGRPLLFHAVEMGAGAGHLCKDILDYLRVPLKDHSFSQDKNDFLESLKYVIVEPHPHFEKKQREMIGSSHSDADHRVMSLQGAGAKEQSHEEIEKNESAEYTSAARSDNITWIKSLKEIDHEITGCILSNELLDAFPVHLVEMEEGLKEIYIDLVGGKFSEVKDRVSSNELTGYFNEFSIRLQRGYRTEINLRIKDWLREVSALLSKGFILTVDYGYSAGDYYGEERTKGTLLCYRGHQTNEDPYHNVGEQDITAHVNFSSLKKWGEEHGLRTIGCCPQGTFLIASGIDEVIMELCSDKGGYPIETAKIRGLIFPQGMGETHSVMVQYKGNEVPQLRGFSIKNHLRYL